MKSIKVCEYSRSRSFHYDFILQDQASGERSQDQWSSGVFFALYIYILYEASFLKFLMTCPTFMTQDIFISVFDSLLNAMADTGAIK